MFFRVSHHAEKPMQIEFVTDYRSKFEILAKNIMSDFFKYSSFYCAAALNGRANQEQIPGVRTLPEKALDRRGAGSARRGAINNHYAKIPEKLLTPKLTRRH